MDRIVVAYTTLAVALHDIDSKGKSGIVRVGIALGLEVIQVSGLSAHR